MNPLLNLGMWRSMDGVEGSNALELPSKHLVIHAVVVGMTGSGKTGLVTVLVEEAALAKVPTLVIDVKGVVLHRLEERLSRLRALVVVDAALLADVGDL